MPNNDPIKDIAMKALTVDNDNCLWDKTLRIMRNVEHISQLPELVTQNLSVDKQALQMAALFSETGYASLAKTRKISIANAVANTKPGDTIDFAIQAVSEKLDGQLPKARIDKINKILVAHNDRFSNMTEAMILSDAKNLEDIGTVGLFNEFRNSAANGKEISATLQSWKRKIDYRYWQARLEESFRFKSVQQIAKRRFDSAEIFMNQLATENSAKDIEEVSLEALDQV